MTCKDCAHFLVCEKVYHFYDNADVSEQCKFAKNKADFVEQKWIDVNDRLPKNYMNCLIYYKHAYNNDDGYCAIGVSYYNGEKFLIDIDWVYQVTHWMPLPEPPKGASNETD